MNHPRIAAAFGLESAGEARFLVLELVPGETLEERIVRGPVPVEESLAIALGIADALEAAHERAIVHRDLKPANVKAHSLFQVQFADKLARLGWNDSGAAGSSQGASEFGNEDEFLEL